MQNVLIVDDSIYKYNTIRKAVSKSRSCNFFYEKTLGEARETLEERHDSGNDFNLIITDTNYPDRGGGELNPEAGFQLIKFIYSLGVRTPIIICSTRKFQKDDTNNVIGFVRYTENADLDGDFRGLLEKL